MKTALILLALALPLAAESSDLEKLRTSWKEARERALEPVDRKYLAALEALKTRLTKAGDLDGALEVSKEIEAIASGPTGGFEGKVTPADLTQGEWRFDVKSPAYTTHLSFHDDGTITERGSKATIGRWTLKGSTLRIEFRKTWNEFSTTYDGAPVLVEKRFDGGRREGVTLTQVR